MALIPTGLFVLTSSYCETRGGVIVRWVQTVSSTPPLVVVAIEKGQHLSPVIRDSRRFGLCQLAPEDRVLRRLFEPAPEASEGNRGVRTETVDPFLGLPTKTTAHGVPILLKAQAWLECELTRHLDVEGNCELYIGLVHGGGVLRSPEQAMAPAAAAGHANGANGTAGANGNADRHANGVGFGRLERHPAVLKQGTSRPSDRATNGKTPAKDARGKRRPGDGLHSRP